MSYVVETYKCPSGATLEIIQDDSPMTPRDWDNHGIVAVFHRNYDFGDNKKKIPFSYDDFDSWAGMRKYIEKDLKAVVCLPIYMYDHSGITINTTGFSCGWDSGQVGFIYCTKEKLVAMGNLKSTKHRVSPKLKADVEKWLISEIETLDQYLTGDVYGFKYYRDKDMFKEQDEVDDSCWGFYGSDIRENGILDHIPKEDWPEEFQEEVTA